MIRCVKDQYSDLKQLNNRDINIVVTNKCNRSCSGCSQHCGLLPKNKLWDIPIQQLEDNIKLCQKISPGREIGIFGGEPMVHPNWKQIWQLLCDLKQQRFLVYTNGIIKKSNPPNNVKYYIIHKTSDSKFYATLKAPIDILNVKDKLYYWKMAKKNCTQWYNCTRLIYNNKAYICELAGPFDVITDSNFGWPIVSGSNPFYVNDETIAKQASQVCYRCGWCFGRIYAQNVNYPIITTKTNLSLCGNKKVNYIKNKKIIQFI